MKMITWSKTTSVLLMLLGCVHDVATFTPLIADGLDTLDEGKAYAVRYMSLMCGTSLVLCGALLYGLFGQMDRHRCIRRACLLISAFLLAAGVMAVAFMPHNPFAWITLALTFVQSLLVMAKNSPERGPGL